MPFDGPSGYVLALEEMARAWAPRRPLATRLWSDQYRKLSGKSAAEPGPWKTSRIPFLGPIMDAMDWGHPAPIVVFTGSEQIAKSECMLNKIGQVIHQDPGPLLVVFPNEKQGGDWKVVRFDPMVEETPALRVLIPKGARAQGGNTQKRVEFPGGVLFTASSGVPSDLAQKSVRYLLIDELDRWPPILEGEGDPVELAMGRLAAFAQRCKTVICSTPTTDETSIIWPWWLRSTMDRYHVPCPHCGHMQHLRWEQLKWIANRPSTAVYACEGCAAAIEEHHKTDMLAAGEWRPEHPEREAEIKGFHANGLMSPLGLGRPWANHATAWERIQGSKGRLQSFLNRRMGEVHKGERIKVEWEQIRNRREPYKLRTIPAGVLTLTSGTDVQADRLETQILGHGRDEQITVIDYVVHYGDTTRTTTSGDGQPSVWSLLDAYLAQQIINAFGVAMRLSCSLIDSGYLPDVVLGFTRTRKARGIYASRGSTNATRQPIGKPSYPDVKRRGKTDARQGVERYEIGVSVLKHWLYELLRADAGTEDKPVQIADRHIRFSADLPDDYFRQLTAETFDPKHGWIERANYQRNESLDCFILARAAAMHHSVNLHRMREADWQRLEELYEPKEGVKPTVAQPVLGVDPISRVVGGFLPTSAKTTSATDLP